MNKKRFGVGDVGGCWAWYKSIQIDPSVSIVQFQNMYISEQNNGGGSNWVAKLDGKLKAGKLNVKHKSLCTYLVFASCNIAIYGLCKSF